MGCSMNPTRRDPCKICGFGVIEHDNSAFDVTCTWCLITQGKPLPPEPPHMRVGDRGETINPRTGLRSPPPTTEWHRAPNTVCTTCYLVTGGLIGSLLTSALLWLR